MRQIAKLLERVRARFRAPRRNLVLLSVEGLGVRGSAIAVVDQVTRSAWDGLAVRVVDERPKTTTSGSLVGFFFDATGSPPLSVGSIITHQSRRFEVRESGDIRGVSVHELH